MSVSGVPTLYEDSEGETRCGEELQGLAALNRLASYRANRETGALTPLETYAVGQRPMWVLMTRLGG